MSNSTMHFNVTFEASEAEAMWWLRVDSHYEEFIAEVVSLQGLDEDDAYLLRESTPCEIHFHKREGGYLILLFTDDGEEDLELTAQLIQAFLRVHKRSPFAIPYALTGLGPVECGVMWISAEEIKSVTERDILDVLFRDHGAKQGAE